MNLLIPLGIGLLAMAAVGIIIWLAWTRKTRIRQRMTAMSSDTDSASSSVPSSQDIVAGTSDRAPLISSILRYTSLWERLQLEILRAGWLLRPSELVSIMGALGFVAAGGALLTQRGWIMAVAMAAFASTIPWWILKARQSQRSKALSAQIPDALDMLTSALRSGFAFMRGLQLIQTQMHPPIAEEFGRVVEEVQFGASLAEALDNLIVRTDDYDLELIVAAVQTQLEVGGNLAEVLGNIGYMIRERVKLSGEVAAATAEGRLSAGILLAMPFGIAFAVNLLNPGYLAPLFNTQLGLMLIGAGGGLMLMGGLIIKKLVDVDY